MKALLADLRRRSLPDWGARALLTAGIGVVGYAIVPHSLALAVADRDVEWAHRIAPSDARIAAEVARARLMANSTSANQSGAERLAQQALRGDATAVPAVTTLGFIAHLRGDLTTARRLFDYAERLSRRDLPTQLWKIEDAVTRDNVPEALHHYDIALRTKPGASDLLFPVLAGTTGDPAIGRELFKTLAAKPIWGNDFIAYAAGNSPDQEATARLFVQLRDARIAIPESVQSSMVDALLAGRHYETAWRYYSTLRPADDRRRSRDGEFATMLSSPSLLDWIPARDTNLSASIQRGEKGGVFEFSAPPGVGGQLLQQVQLLTPGRYVLEGRSTGIDQPEDARPYWTLTCGPAGGELGRIPLPNSAENDGKFSGSFIVPMNCPAQYLLLMARPSDTAAGASGQIEQVQLRPAG